MSLQKVFITLVVILSLMVCGTMASAAYYVYFETPYLSYPELPFKVIEQPVKAGDAVKLTIKRCNSSSKTRIYTLSHVLVEEWPELGYTLLPATAVSLTPGCTTSISTVNVTLKNTKPGRYHVEGVAEITGTIRSMSVDWTSDPFEVVE